MSKSKRAMTQEGRAGRPASEPSLIPLSPESARPSTLLANKGFRRILSARRFVVILSTFLLSLLVGLGTLSFLLVGQIFAQLTPATARDLAWKAERGVAELSFTTELGVVLAEEERLEQAAHTYLADEDVRALLIRDIDKKVLFSYPSSPAAFDELFLGRPLVPHETAEAFSAWSPIEIEGAEVGSVGLSVSKARLLAGDDLRFRILATTSVGAVIALILSAFFVSLYIAPLIRLTERAFFDLEQRTQEALDSARLKSEFLANMSHEIRTPMNGIIGMADLLKKTSLSDTQRRYTRTITASASALLTIINDILDFSKIEAGKLAVRPTETDVRHLAEEVTQLHAAPGQLKSIEVMCVVAPDVPRMLMADHDRLRQVLNNIMSNAVKFTQHGSVVMRVWVQERSVGAGSREVWRIGFSVTDTGIGIASEDHERVFELFSQVDGSLTRTRGGTGLGLSISRHLVGLMGGHLRMTSELDQGSCFEFALPLEVRDEVSSIPSRKLPPTLLLSQPGAQLTVIDEILDLWGVPTEKAYQAGEALDLLARRHRSGEQFGLILCEDGLSGVADFAQRVRDESLQPDARLVLLARMSSPMRDGQYFDDTLPMPPVDDDLRRVVLGSSSRRSDPTDERGLRRFVDRPRLLVAEDNVINREVMREMLHTLKLDADLVEDGKQALEAIERSHYPLILMDCQMPLMDGYEATKCIRARTDEKRHVPIIAVTATALLSERDKAFAAGMNDYVTKPVLIARLTQALSPFLKSAPGPASLGVPHPAPGPDTPLAESRPTTPSNRPKDNPPQREALARRGSEPAAEPHLHPGTRRSPAVATLFRRMIPDQLELLEQAISLRDAAEVKRVAHKLKGSCLALGARQMAALCAQLEPLPTDAQVRLVALRHEHQAVLEALASEGNS